MQPAFPLHLLTRAKNVCTGTSSPLDGEQRALNHAYTRAPTCANHLAASGYPCARDYKTCATVFLKSAELQHINCRWIESNIRASPRSLKLERVRTLPSPKKEQKSHRNATWVLSPPPQAHAYLQQPTLHMLPPHTDDTREEFGDVQRGPTNAQTPLKSS